MQLVSLIDPPYLPLYCPDIEIIVVANSLHHAYTTRSRHELQGIVLSLTQRHFQADQNQNMFLGFAGVVTAVAAWSIWGGDMFPAQPDPTGDPEKWSEEDMKRWLNAVWTWGADPKWKQHADRYHSEGWWLAARRQERNYWLGLKPICEHLESDYWWFLLWYPRIHRTSTTLFLSIWS